MQRRTRAEPLNSTGILFRYPKDSLQASSRNLGPWGTVTFHLVGRKEQPDRSRYGRQHAVQLRVSRACILAA